MEDTTNGLNKLDDQWAPLQAKVFTRWVCDKLKGVEGVNVGDVRSDLSSGVALVELAQVLTGKDAPSAWARDPKRDVDAVQNCELALQMFASDGARFVNMSGKDIHDGNENLTLGLVWTLILRYQLSSAVVGEGEKSRGALPPLPSGVKATGDAANKERLYSWAENRTASYSSLKDYKRYDLSMCALLDSYVPEKINYANIDPKNSQAELATKTMEELGIPVYVYPDELQATGNKVDEKTLVTQLSAAKLVLDRMPSKKLAQPAAESRELLADSPMGLTDTFKTPAQSESAAATEQAAVEEPKRELVCEHPMHLSDVFSQHNLVSDHPMGLTDTFKTPEQSEAQQSEKPAAASEVQSVQTVSEHPMHLSDVFSQHNLVSDHPMGLSSLFGVTSEPPVPLEGGSTDDQKRELVSEHPMHLSDVFSQHNLVSDHPMGLSSVFNSNSSVAVHKKVTITTIIAPGVIVVPTEFKPIIMKDYYHSQHHTMDQGN